MQQPGPDPRGRLPDFDATLSVLRWVTIAVVFLLAWANPDRPTHIAFLLAVYNAALSLVMTHAPALRAPSTRFAADILAVSLVLSLSGGLDSPAYIVYFLSIVALAKHQAVPQTAAATAVVSLIYASVCLAATPGDWTIGRWETLMARIAVLLSVAVIAGVLIQEIRLQEEAGRQERERAARWQELERMRGSLLSTVSHEFKTPLTAIRTATDLLLASPEALTDTQVRLLDNVRRNEQRLAGLVNDLLDMARLESGQLTLRPEELDLGEVLEESMSALRPLAQIRDQQMRLDLPTALPPVWADRRRLGQIVGNLLSNALQFSPPGGQVLVEASEMDPVTDAGGTEQAGFVRISVADQGPGIPEHERALIFDRFYAGSQRRTGGTGLGLSIARSLAELHGGRIWLESAVGAGSTFHVALPRAASQPAEAE